MTNVLVLKVAKNKQKEEKDDKRIDSRKKRKSKEALAKSGKDPKNADDFIMDKESRPIALRRQKKSSIFSEIALQESQDIFCINFDYHKLRIYIDEDYKEDERDALVQDERRSGRSYRQESKTFDEEGSEGDHLDTDDLIVNDEDRPIAGKRPIFFYAALQEA